MVPRNSRHAGPPTKLPQIYIFNWDGPYDFGTERYIRNIVFLHTFCFDVVYRPYECSSG